MADDIALRWHVGFILPVGSVCNVFRGPAMPHLARWIAGDGVLDAAVIGHAATSLRRDPEAWRDWGTPEQTLQHLKQLFHVLLLQGSAGFDGAEKCRDATIDGDARGSYYQVPSWIAGGRAKHLHAPIPTSDRL